MARLTDARLKILTRIGISFVLLIVGLYVVLSKSYDADTRAWAAAVVGVVLGYWLR